MLASSLINAASLLTLALALHAHGAAAALAWITTLAAMGLGNMPILPAPCSSS